MKRFAILLSAVLVAPGLTHAQRGGATSGAASANPPAAPVVTVPQRPVARATSPVVPTPRAGGILPRGPGGVNHPPVISAPPSLGRTFQRSLLETPTPGFEIFDPAAAVPTTIPPTQVEQAPLDPRFPVVGVPEGVIAPFPAAPLRVPNLVDRTGRRVVLRPFQPVRIPDRPVVFDFPPGTTVLTEPRAVPNPPANLPLEPVVVPDLAERGTEAAAQAGEAPAAIGSAPGVQQGQFTSPPRIRPGPPAGPRVESRLPGTGAQIVRPRQLRTD